MFKESIHTDPIMRNEYLFITDQCCGLSASTSHLILLNTIDSNVMQTAMGRIKITTVATPSQKS